MARTKQPVRVAAVNDYELIVAGVAELLARFPERLTVCERLVIGDPIETPIDVALYDTYGRIGIAEPALRTLSENPKVARVAMFSLDLSPDLISEGRAAGASGFISKALSAEQIAAAIVRIARGEMVVAATPSPRPAISLLNWPGKDDGLTERESQVIVLAAEGLTNREIAAALYIAPETVKSYLSEVFTKLRLRNRVEATNYVRDSGAFTRYQPAEPALHPEDEVEGPVSDAVSKTTAA